MPSAASHLEEGLSLWERVEGLGEKLFLQAIRPGAGTQVPVLVAGGDFRVVERVGAGRRSLERH